MDNSKQIGRIVYFKYILLIFLIFNLVAILISYSRNTGDSQTDIFRIHSNLFNAFLQYPFYFSIQLIIDLLIIYVLAGLNGKRILKKRKSPFSSTFLYTVYMWLGFFIVGMISEIVYHGLDRGFSGKLVIAGIQGWLIYGLALFLFLAFSFGLALSLLVGKELRKKNATQQIS